MTNDVLLIFLSSSNGQTKLSQSLGEQKAQEINEKLQVAACSSTKSIPCTKVVVTADETTLAAIWNKDDFRNEAQIGKYLNNKLQNAFAKYIIQDKEDVNKVVFITADCPQLTQQIIEKAFESLNKYDVCIGPEKKGSYYLIGMKEPMPFLFDNKLWSANTLLDDTLEELMDKGKKYFLLPELQSVNDIYDLHLVK
jgi:glycosyltransferase A (GT-A) superfamily protein (DUF2064 family)